jgi:hypothetical protein
LRPDARQIAGGEGQPVAFVAGRSAGTERSIVFGKKVGLVRRRLRGREMRRERSLFRDAFVLYVKFAKHKRPPSSSEHKLKFDVIPAMCVA